MSLAATSPRSLVLSGLIALLCSSPSAHAISITIQYENPMDGFFTSEAQTTISKAASDISYAITSTLGSLTQDVYTGTSGAASASANWYLTYTNPNDNTTQTLNTFSFASNEIIIKVGTRDLGGSTLGVGGPGGAGFSLSGSGSGASFTTAVDNMEAASNAGMLRGGPTLSTLNGTFGPEPYSLSYGYAIGSLAFNNTATWNKSYATGPSGGQNDLYSVALHEMLHVIGFGIGDTWDSNVSGQNWTGAAVISLLGDGTNKVNAGGDHINNGLTGKAIIDGVITTTDQEASMDPNITVGTRKYLTTLDLAFLQDMGWQVVPEPSSSMMILVGLSWLCLRRKRVG